MESSLNDYLPDCAICYDPLDKNLITSTSCGHIFHGHWYNYHLLTKTFSLDKWIMNDNICPICRRVIKNKLRILFDFKECPQKVVNLEGDAKILHETLMENSKLIKESRVLKEEKNQLEENFIKMNEQVVYFANQFAEVNQNVKEYKNKLIDLSCKLDEKGDKVADLTNELIDRDNIINLLQKAKKELEDTIGTNKEIIGLMSQMEETEKEFNIKETVNDFLKQSEGVTKLTTFIFVLHQKIKNYQEEIEYLKKQKTSNKRESYIDSVNDKTLYALISDNQENNNLTRKRKFTEMNSQVNNTSINYEEGVHNLSKKQKHITTLTNLNKNSGITMNNNINGYNNINQISERTEKIEKAKQFPTHNYIPSLNNPFINTNKTVMIGTSVNISNPGINMKGNMKIPNLIKPQYSLKDSFLKKK